MKELIHQFTTRIEENASQDIGFDVMVELREKDTGDRHLILGQCKYRTNEDMEVDMSSYVGKYHDIVFVLDQLNKLAEKEPHNVRTMLMPFFWLSTEVEPDAMNYFGNLRKAGKIFFFGNEAFQLESGVLNLVANVKERCQEWRDDYRVSSTQSEFSFCPKQPRAPMDHQCNAIADVVKHCKDTMGCDGGPKPASVIMATGSGKTLTSFLAVRRLESMEDGIGLKQYCLEHDLAASVHFSPMVRLVIQNAHEWLAEETALEGENFNMIYFCVCSVARESAKWTMSTGCTVRVISVADVAGVFHFHRKRRMLHLCRFFTTYQAGRALRRVCRKMNLNRGKMPSTCLFGVSMRDEAHVAVGKRSKSHGAGLFINARVSLNFTATSKYSWYHLQKIYPSEFGEFDEGKYKKDHANYSTMDTSLIFPQVEDCEIAAAEIDESTLYQDVIWEATDLIDDDMLWKKCDGTQCQPQQVDGQYTWESFQGWAEEIGRPVVVFSVDGSSLRLENHNGSDRSEYHDTIFDSNDCAVYFGVVPKEDSPSFDITSETACFGVDPTMAVLFTPASCSPHTRGFSLNDMSGLGGNNRIGRVVHSLSYYECFEAANLIKPRCITLGIKGLPEELFQTFNLCLRKVYGEEKPLHPQSNELHLTIGKSIESGRAHQFRSMKLLCDCLMNDPTINRVLVFCKELKESKTCKRILDAMLMAYPSSGSNSRVKIYTDIIYSSETHEGEIKDTMEYDRQQSILSRFCAQERAVLFNAKLISIGVDLPSIDTCMIVNPSKSPADITQKIGRALRVDRRNANKKATVIIPYVSHITPDEGWPVPIHEAFEEDFLLIKRVVDSMVDPGIKMISSYTTSNVRGLSDENEDKKNPFAIATIHKLLDNLKGRADPPAKPIFDASFSKVVLSAWEPVGCEVNHSAAPRPVRVDPAVAAAIEDKKNASKAFIIVAFVSFCHDKRDNNGKSRIWYPSKLPFSNEKGPHLNLEDPADERRLGMLELLDLEMDVLRRVTKSRQGNHKKNETFLSDFQSLDSDVRQDIVSQFLERLGRDIESGPKAHAHWLETFCASVESLECAEHHGDHHVANFLPGDFEFSSFAGEFREFILPSQADIKWLASERKALKTPNSKVSTEKKTKSTARKRSRNDETAGPSKGLDEVDLGLGSLGLDDDLPPEKNDSQVRKQLEFD